MTSIVSAGTPGTPTSAPPSFVLNFGEYRLKSVPLTGTPADWSELADSLADTLAGEKTHAELAAIRAVPGITILTPHGTLACDVDMPPPRGGKYLVLARDLVPLCRTMAQLAWCHRGDVCVADAGSSSAHLRLALTGEGPPPVNLLVTVPVGPGFQNLSALADCCEAGHPSYVVRDKAGEPLFKFDEHTNLLALNLPRGAGEFLAISLKPSASYLGELRSAAARYATQLADARAARAAEARRTIMLS